MGLLFCAAGIVPVRREDNVSARGEAGEHVQGHERTLFVVHEEVPGPP